MQMYKEGFNTGVIEGQGPRSSDHKVTIPYGGKDPSKPYYLFRNNNTVLEGKALFDQLDRWVAYGSIEPSAADAIKAVADHPEWLDLSDRVCFSCAWCLKSLQCVVGSTLFVDLLFVVEHHAPESFV
jgi:hypothetical protein